MAIIDRLKLNWLFFKGMNLGVSGHELKSVGLTKNSGWWREAFGPSLTKFQYLKLGPSIIMSASTLTIHLPGHIAHTYIYIFIESRSF